VFENRVLRKTFGSKRDEVTGGWRKFHNDKLHNWYSSRNITWAGHVERMEEMKDIGYIQF
jgi:hypothetical protein